MTNDTTTLIAVLVIASITCPIIFSLIDIYMVSTTPPSMRKEVVQLTYKLKRKNIPSDEEAQNIGDELCKITWKRFWTNCWRFYLG